MGPRLVRFEPHSGNASSVKEERRVLSGGVNLIVVLEFHEWQDPHPIILSLMGEELEILFQFLVDPFHLSITLRVVGSGGCQLNSEYPVEFPGEFRYELGTSIGDDFLRETVVFPHMVEEKVCGSGGRDFSNSGNEMCALCDGINDNYDGIMSCRLWQLDNKIHTNSVPWSRWNRKRVELPGRRMSE